MQTKKNEAAFLFENTRKENEDNKLNLFFLVDWIMRPGPPTKLTMEKCVFPIGFQSNCPTGFLKGKKEGEEESPTSR